MLMDMMLVATTATTGFDVWDSVKVKLVEAWCQGVTNAPTTITIDWNGGATSAADDSKIDADTSMGIEPAHVYSKPAKKSLASFWNSSTATVAFSITCPNETVIDVELTYRNSSVAPNGAANALVGATPGQFYYRGMDGLAAAGTRYPAQAVLTI
jgi:hypothetical protein